MKRKLTAFLLVFIMLCSAFPVFAGFDDISGLECEQDVRFLEALGIVEGYTATEYAPDELLSRAEMVTIALRTMDLYAPDYTGAPLFDDVNDEYWAYYEICAAHEMGLVSGVGGGMFAPEAAVTFNQAVKMLVNVLGYGFMAKVKGGYPAGYLEVARRLDLDYGITLGGEKEITRGEMAILVANALNANVAEISELGMASEEYFQKISSGGEILVKYYHDIDRLEGRVNADYFRSIYGSLAPDDNTIIVGNEILCAGNSDIERMIGEDVVAYIDRDSTDSPYPTVVFAYSDSDEVLTLNSCNADYDSSSNTIIYENDDGREKEIKLSNADIFVNGIEKLRPAAGDFANADIKYISGSDSNLVMINSYTDKVVKGTDTEEEIIFIDNDTDIVLDDYDRFSVCNTYGQPVDLSEIVKWNILSCYSSNRNGVDVFIAIVSDDEAVEGTVDELSTAGSITEVTVGEKVYTVSSTVSGTLPPVGASIRFYTNHMGQIACVSTEIVGYKYGYLRGMKPESFQEGAQARIFTHEGEFKIFNLSENLKVNNAPADLKLLESNSSFYENGKLKEQLIRYEVGGNDTIKSITTCSDSIVAPSDRQTFGRNFYAIDAQARWLGTFATKYTIDQDTLYFTVPVYENPEDKAYKVTPVKNLSKFSSNVGNAYFYDVDEDNVIGVILRIMDTTIGDGFDFKGASEVITYGVVSSKKTVYDEDRGEAKALTVITEKNGEKTVIIDEEQAPIRMTINANVGCSVITTEQDPCYGETNISYNNVDIGDIMIFRLDENGVAYDSQMLVRRKYPKVYESLSIENPSQYYSETGYYEWASSTVRHISEHGIIADVNIYSGGPYERLYLKAPKVLAYDSEKDTVKAITWDSVREGERFSTCDWSIYPSIVLVYR